MNSVWKAVATTVLLALAAALMAGCAATTPKFTGASQASADNSKDSSFDTLPKPRKLATPKYPGGALACAREGDVWVEVLVGVDGKVYDAMPCKTCPGYESSPFETVALESARQGIWYPAVKDGKKVAVWAAYEIQFKYGGDGEHASDYCDQIAKLNAKYTDLDKAPIPWDLKEVPCPDGAKKKDCKKGVWVRVLVNVDGTVADAELMNSDDKDTPEGLAALEVARQGVWEPAEKDGKKVEAWVAYESEFK